MSRDTVTIENYERMERTARKMARLADKHINECDKLRTELEQERRELKRFRNLLQATSNLMIKEGFDYKDESIQKLSEAIADTDNSLSAGEKETQKEQTND